MLEIPILLTLETPILAMGLLVCAES